MYNLPSLCFSFHSSQKPRYGKATQSVLVVNPWVPFGHAHNAIDGNTDSNYNHGSTSETPYWTIDPLTGHFIRNPSLVLDVL